MISPLKKVPSLAKNQTACEISSGLTSLFSGNVLRNSGCLSGESCGIKGVSVGPGATAFTRILNGAYSKDKVFTKPICAPLAAE